MSKIKENIENIKKNTPNSTTLLVATKYASLEETQAVIDGGVTTLGENKVQDAKKKISALSNPAITWHMIGHLQTNKVNKAVRLFDVIQSIDSEKLLNKVSASAQNINKTQTILLQVNIANDPKKFGFSKEEFLKILPSLKTIQNVHIKGIMVIVPNTDNESELRDYFRAAKDLLTKLQAICSDADVLSMGMSNDYKLAVEEGSTMIRVGRSIFKG